MPRTWFSTSGYPRKRLLSPESGAGKVLLSLTGPDDPATQAEVTLSQFASIVGMTREEYVRMFFAYLESGTLLNLLSFESRCELEDWILRTGRYDDQGKFCVMFRMSSNLSRNVVLYCSCRMDLAGDEPLLKVDRSFAGFEDEEPAWALNLDAREVLLGDLETRFDVRRTGSDDESL